MSTWPKKLPTLTAEQDRIRDDFMKHWHEVLPSRYSAIESFNHRYPLREWTRPSAGCRTLEIGAGLGEHIGYEQLEGIDYYALELREDMAARIRERFPGVKTIVGDIQQALDFPKQSFDRIIAIHVLEHLPNLPAALKEIHRLLNPAGRFDVVIPCEGGMAYTLARRISAQRIFEKRYNMSYDWFVKSEHINLPHEILRELKRYFKIERSRHFPLLIPSVTMNLVIGLKLSPIAPAV
jgi:SAM-dependent methyltransferase